MMRDSQRLDPAQIERFVSDGYLRLDDAFPRVLADEARAILWRETGCAPDDPSTWTRPVVRLGGHAGPPFDAISRAPRLHAAFDALVGAGRWLPLLGLGTFPIRFPVACVPDDTGWHVDASFAGADSTPHDFLTWRCNVASQGRALLLLVLLSDVGDDDAPTRIRVGSHAHTARALAPAGDAGMNVLELARVVEPVTAALPEAVASGPAGTVYLCHPFLVHAAQAHLGTRPRFMAQPPLLPVVGARDGAAESAVERAIRLALTSPHPSPEGDTR
jgi:hypothetical protein